MNLIYQYFIPYQGVDAKYNFGSIGLPEWAKIGMNSARQYAYNIGAKYIFSNQIYMHSTLNVFESLRVIFDETFDQYDKVLILDIDTIINTTENIFNYDIEDIGMVHEYGVYNRTHPTVNFNTSFWNRYFNDPKKGVITYAKNYLNPDFEWKKSNMYPDEPFALYNGGLQLWSKEGRLKAREIFGKKTHDHFKSITDKTETPYLNMMLMAYDFKITELEMEWNKLNYQWSIDGDMGKITHYNDVSKNEMLTHGK